jgi:diadenosine tetraphosphatase ApaH/serine/threonine PP2A family protein phosphatase
MLAALYDIHGNLPALQAVLDDAAIAGAERFVLGGDYAAFGAWPTETVATLDDLDDATWIRGNWDRWTGGDDLDMPRDDLVRDAGRFAAHALGSTTVARLAALPPTVHLDDVLFCHASPGSDMEAFAPSDPARDAVLLEGVHQHLVVSGHIHVQFQREAVGRRTVMNPGSVGLPFDGDRRAAYALIAPNGTVDLRRVEYDVGASISALRAHREPWAQAIADKLERAAF